MTSIAIVVTHPELYASLDSDHDTRLLLEAFRARGIEAHARNWHDPAVRWEDHDLVVLRSPWDYAAHAGEFARWLDHLESVGAHLVNEPSLVRWNSDKTYLADLESVGVQGVPTTYHRDLASFTAAVQTLVTGAEDRAGSDEPRIVDPEVPHIVVKPSVSAGSDQTGLFAADDPKASALAAAILARGKTVMLQPEVPELSHGREKALYLIDGRFTHAIAKGALLARGGGLIGGVYRENRVIVPVTAAEQEFAARALHAVTEVTGGAVPLYARIDLVDTEAWGIVLLEAELIEPSLNLDVAPDATGPVVDAILERAEGRARRVGA